MSELVDETALIELRDVMGDLFSKLVDTFHTDGQVRIQAMYVAINDQDSESLRKAAHTFKGSASNVCALHLASRLKAIEDFAKAGEFEQAQALVAQVELLLPDVVSALTDS